MSKRNYHMSMRPTDAKRTFWRCQYCGAEAADPNKLAASECRHKYPACNYCGGSDESNECRPDCRGIAVVLSDSRMNSTALVRTYSMAVRHVVGCKCRSPCGTCGHVRKTDFFECTKCGHPVGPCAASGIHHVCSWCVSEAARELEEAEQKRRQS